MRRLVLAVLAVLLASCGSSGSRSTTVTTAAGPPVPGDICPQLLQAGPGIPEIPVSGTLRVLAFGDFGTGKASQHRVATGMRAQKPYHFGVTLGDNFYEKGLNSPTHPRWQTDWEDLYSDLDIRVYATLGNHDYGDPASPPAEMARSPLSQTWCLPKPYYTYVAGPVQFFAIDTDPIAKGAASVPAQIKWLKESLAASKATWKVVYGHHPIYTNGEHGGSAGVIPAVKGKILDVLKDNKVDLYLAGHDHDLEALKPEGGVWFFVSGGGGTDLRPLKTSKCRQWAKSVHGFTVLEADKETLTVGFFDDDGKAVPGSSVVLKKGSPAPDCER